MIEQALFERRLVQERVSSSAVNAEVLNVGSGVPGNKVWTILGLGYFPDVAETQVVSFEKVTRTGNALSVLNPVSLALQPSVAGCLEQGMEITLLPGEYIRVRRAAHTVGSTMSAVMQFVEEDLPFYIYEEPQIKKRQALMVSEFKERATGLVSSRPTPGGGPAIVHGGTPRSK